MKYLDAGAIVNMVVYNYGATATEAGTGIFSGFRVY